MKGTDQLELFARLLIDGCPLAHPEKVIDDKRLIRILPQPANVLTRHGIDNIEILVTADLVISVQNTIVGYSVMYADQTIIEIANINKTTGQAKSSAAYML